VSDDSTDREQAPGGGSEDDNVRDDALASAGAADADGAAFGAPGIAPAWCSSDKDYVSTALGGSRLWATVGHGIINEIYWPSTGQPQVRDFGFYLIGDGSAGRQRWFDLKRVRDYSLSTPGPYLPALTITHHGDDYELTLEVLPDPRRDVLLVRFNISGPYRLAAIVAPQLGSTGRHNSAWVDAGCAYARHGDFCMCLAADPPLLKVSCGYVGASDGWQRVDERAALEQPFGLWAVRLSAAELSGPAELSFTRRYDDRWEGVDHRVALGHAGQERALSSFG
jgi:hypothetical protein